MSAVLTEIINLITTGLADYAAGFGAGLKAAIESIFLTTSEAGAVTGLSTAGGLIVVFAGLALAISLTRLVFGWVTSLGASR